MIINILKFPSSSNHKLIILISLIIKCEIIKFVGSRLHLNSFEFNSNQIQIEDCTIISISISISIVFQFFHWIELNDSNVYSMIKIIKISSVNYSNENIDWYDEIALKFMLEYY